MMDKTKLKEVLNAWNFWTKGIRYKEVKKQEG